MSRLYAWAWKATGLLGPNVLPVGRGRLAAKYAAMRMRLATHGVGPGHDQIMGRSVEAADYSTLLYLFYEVFVQQDYAFNAVSDTPRIIDAGANIGMATLFFKIICPGARIDAFEPSPEAFRLLSRNVAANQLTDVRLHNSALASCPGTINLFTEPGDETSLTASTVHERGGGQSVEVEAVTLSSQIEDEVDLLKLDVEGSEGEVLEETAAAGKLDLIREIIVEYHHNIPNGDGSLAGFLSLLEQQGFRYRLKAEARTLQDREFQDVLVRAYRVGA